MLTEAEFQTLSTVYHYLRRVENILQEIGDQQTQTLPDNDRDRWRVTVAMGYPSWDAFLAGTAASSSRQINLLFSEVIGEAEEQESDIPTIWQDMWHSHLPAEDLIPLLLQQQVEKPEKLAGERLAQLRDECLHRPIGPQESAGQTGCLTC